MNLLLIQKAAEEKNADQLFAYIEDYRKSSEYDADSEIEYELNLLMDDYENNRIDDEKFCTDAQLIFNTL